MHIVGRIMIMFAFVTASTAALGLGHAGEPAGRTRVSQASRDPAEIRNLRMYYEKIEANLAEGNIKSARSYLRSAQRVVEQPSAETSGHPDFARLKKQLPRVEKQIDAREAELEEGGSQDESMADAHGQLGYGKGYLERDRDEQGRESFQKCLTLVDAVLKKNPEWKKKTLPPRVGDKMTGGQLRAECARNLAAADEKIEEGVRKKSAEAQAELDRVVKNYWKSSNEWLAAARKEKKKKDPYAALDASNAYAATLDQIGRITEPMKRVLEETPKMKSAPLVVDKEKTTLGEFYARATELQEEATAERDKNKVAAEKAGDKWDRAFLGGVKGDRRSVARRYGYAPSQYDGDDFKAASKRLQSVKKAGVWVYTVDDCETEYHFRGSKLVRTVPKC
jgi:hypothetical protein